MEKTYKHNDFTAVFTDKDGHFSLTGDMGGGSGAVGDKIVKIDSRFDLLNKMHLSDCKTGEPMHSWENADYFLKDVNIDAFKRQLRHKTSEYMAAWTALHEAKNLEKDISGYDARVTTPTVERFQQIKEEIVELWQKDADEVRKIAESIPSDLREQDEDIELDDFEEPEKAQALAQHLNCHFSEITPSDYNESLFTGEGKEFMVMTDDEADTEWNEYLESYIDECLEIPDNMKAYFDREAWKREARIDGRGHSLNHWDGSEDFETVDGEAYYIYRQ